MPSPALCCLERAVPIRRSAGAGSVDTAVVTGLDAGMKSIGEVAARFGLPTHVLRHWEAEGLLSPARDGDRRRYTDADLHRVAAILISNEAGFGLADIRAMLGARTAPDRHEVMARHREALLTRIARAQAALDMLEGGQECLHDAIKACPHFRGLLADRVRAVAGPGSR
jgi:MerR family copper efflux transcriptional regulator